MEFEGSGNGICTKAVCCYANVPWVLWSFSCPQGVAYKLRTYMSQRILPLNSGNIRDGAFNERQPYNSIVAFMPATITLSDGDSITYKDAENRGDNILLELIE